MKRAMTLVISAAATLAIAACSTEPGSNSGERVGAEQLLNAASDSDNWISYGRTYDEQRFSPLDKVNADNVGELGLEWFADMDTARGQEATPLVLSLIHI